MLINIGAGPMNKIAGSVENMISRSDTLTLTLQGYVTHRQAGFV